MMQTWTEVSAMLAAQSRSSLEHGVALLLRTAILLIAALIVGWLLREAHPRTRAGIYAMGLAAAAVLLALTAAPYGLGRSLCTVALPRSVAAAAPIDGERAISETVSAAHATAASGASLPATEVTTSSKTRNRSDIAISPILASAGATTRSAPEKVVYCALLMAWICGAVACVTWLWACHCQLVQIRRRADLCAHSHITDTLEALCRKLSVTRPALLVSSEAASPFVMGLWRPCIVLPTRLTDSANRETIGAVLAHEMHHIVSRDIAWTFGGRLLCALLWPQPLIWALQRRWREATEEACDRAALEHDCSPQSYARCLVAIAEAFAKRGATNSMALGMADSRSLLGRRIERILDGRKREERRLPPAAVGGLLCVFALLLMFAGRMVGAQSAESPVSPMPPKASLSTPRTTPIQAEQALDRQAARRSSAIHDDKSALEKLTAEDARHADEQNRARAEERRARDRDLARQVTNSSKIGVERRQAEKERSERLRADELSERLNRAADIEKLASEREALLREREIQARKLRVELSKERAKRSAAAEQDMKVRDSLLLELHRQADKQRLEELEQSNTILEMNRQIENRRPNEMTAADNEAAVLRKELVERQTRLLDMEQTYAPSHPKMQAAHAVIQSLRNRIAALTELSRQSGSRAAGEGSRLPETGQIDRARSNKLQAELKESRSRLNMLQATLTRQMAELRAERDKTAYESAMLRAEMAMLKKEIEELRRQKSAPREPGK